MIHFISGLPRSGSTLLASLLRQNPRFSAHVQSPVGQIVTTAVEQMSTCTNESAVFLTDTQRTEILRGIFAGYYQGYPDLVFDSNRRWCANMALVDRLFPGAKVIACVRPVAEIVDSFERLFMRDPTQVSRVLGSSNTIQDVRIQKLMAPGSVVGFSYSALRDAYFGLYRGNLVVVEFRHLISNPLKVLRDLHEILSEPWFDYDIHTVASPPGVDVFDAFLGNPGMHEVQPDVKRNTYVPALPDFVARALPPSFWIPDAEKNSDVKSVR